MHFLKILLLTISLNCNFVFFTVNLPGNVVLKNSSSDQANIFKFFKDCNLSSAEILSGINKMCLLAMIMSMKEPSLSSSFFAIAIFEPLFLRIFFRKIKKDVNLGTIIPCLSLIFYFFEKFIKQELTQISSTKNELSVFKNTFSDAINALKTPVTKEVGVVLAFLGLHFKVKSYLGYLFVLFSCFNSAESGAAIANSNLLSFAIPAQVFLSGDSTTTYKMLLDGKVLPDWLNFDKSSFVISGLPPMDKGSWILTIIATNQNGLNKNFSFPLSYNKDVAPEIVRIIYTVPDAIVGISYSYLINTTEIFYDRNNYKLVYSVVNLPKWMKANLISDEYFLFIGKPAVSDMDFYNDKTTKFDLIATNKANLSAVLPLNIKVTGESVGKILIKVGTVFGVCVGCCYTLYRKQGLVLNSINSLRYYFFQNSEIDFFKKLVPTYRKPSISIFVGENFDPIQIPLSVQEVGMIKAFIIKKKKNYEFWKRGLSLIPGGAFLPRFLVYNEDENWLQQKNKEVPQKTGSYLIQVKNLNGIIKAEFVLNILDKSNDQEIPFYDSHLDAPIKLSQVCPDIENNETDSDLELESNQLTEKHSLGNKFVKKTSIIPNSLLDGYESTDSFEIANILTNKFQTKTHTKHRLCLKNNLHIN